MRLKAAEVGQDFTSKTKPLRASICPMNTSVDPTESMGPSQKAGPPATTGPSSPSDSTWERHFAELVAFHQQHGHTRVTRNNQTAPGLSDWRDDQCAHFRQGKLSAERQARLTDLGFEFEPAKRLEEEQKQIWETRFAALQAFREVHGHCRVPERQDRVLNGWVEYQRQGHRENRLDATRRERLDQIGFEWEPLEQNDRKWEQRLNELAAFRQQYGHLDVIPGNETVPGLADWRDRQRALFREGRMTEERRERLEALGFEWVSPRGRVVAKSPHSISPQNEGLPKDAISRWEAFYNRLAAFQAEHGHLKVPFDSAEHRQLANWVREQHEGLEYGRLHLDQIDRLKRLGLF